MDGFTNMLTVMAVLLGLCGILWIVGHMDQGIQKLRGVKPDGFGRRHDGLLAKIVMVVVFGGGIALYAMSGTHIDPEFTYRR